MFNLEAQQNSDDYLVRAVALGGQIRAFAGRTTGLAEEARQRHETWPTATAALGRTLTAGLLLALDLKGDNALTIRVMGDGPLGAIVVSADAAGGVRGYVQEPQVLMPSRSGKLDVGGAVGCNGTLYVSKDLGMKEPYVGSVPLVSGEIAEDITYYLAASEQIPAVTALGVLVDTGGKVLASGGYILQVMPGAEESTIAYLEERISQAVPVTNLFTAGLSPEEILNEVLGPEVEVKVLDRQKVAYKCPCSRERLKDILISLGSKELEEILQEQGEAEVRCHFCNEVYLFSETDLQELLMAIQPRTAEADLPGI